MFQIDLTPEGELQLVMPTGYSIVIPPTVGGLRYIQKVIYDHHREVRNQRGYIGTLPTQHAVDKAFADQFLAEKRKKQEEERRNGLKTKLDIDWDKLEINL